MAALLTRLGHRVRLARDGAEAVATVQQQVPDLVFMDVHMPQMDGLEATRLLRAGLAPAAQVPIVAVSADVFAETQAQVRAAGMDNFLSKPVRMADIHQMLVARFGDRARVTALLSAPVDLELAAMNPPATALSPAPRRRFRASDVASQLDMTVIGDVCVGVGLAGYRSILTALLEDGSGNQAKLLAALDRADVGELKALAHSLKGASASLGLRAVQAQAHHIEQAGIGFTPAEASAVAEHLRQLLESTRALLQRMGFV